MSQKKNVAIPVTKFKAQCLEMVEAVRRKRTSIVISKRGTVVAELIPSTRKSTAFVGSMRGTVKEIGDILSPIEDEWEANG